MTSLTQHPVSPWAPDAAAVAPASALVAAPGPPATGTGTVAVRRSIWRRPWVRWTTAPLATACGCALVDVTGEEVVDVDPVRLMAVSAGVLAGFRWQYAVVVIVLAAAHYAAAAVATRAAAGLPLPFGQTVLVQLAASAANRLTPLGTGGAAVNIRYFSRQGQPYTAAVGAVVLLTGVGAVADLGALAVIVVGGRWIGVGGVGAGMPALTSGATGLLQPLHWPALWAATGLVLTGIATTPSCRRALHRVGAFLTPFRQLAGHPARLAALSAASASTTVLLGIAFIASAAMVGGVQPSRPFGALLVGFMIAGAAGAAVPVPAGVGATEIALIAVLVSAGMPGGHATEAVILFRVVTFWLPAVAGVAATRHLHRTGAL